ncbi:competence protein CoiA family protein [Oceanospirillum sp.]|uniref:competence protein CoiA family protein n=1 Tax=Oceanospirillum sp. TaxID=2021254 RepID=UPI003A9258D0
MGNLKIPYGVNTSGEFTSAYSAEKGSVYFCPCCGERLIYRDGDVRAKHFAHPASSNCSFESVLHITAKELIRSIIENNADGRQEINLENHCQNCGVLFSSKLPINTFSSAGLEVKVGDYICDVVGYRNGSIGLAIEILNTHAVDAIKARNLQVYWVELKAEDVLNNPENWIPLQSNLKKSYCPDCKNHLKHVRQVADKYGIDRSLYSPIKNPAKANYLADIETCFRCGHEIPVFWWRGVPFCEVKPPSPMPKTIQYRYSKRYGGSYWANTCANCNMIQGDNFLYINNDAPFKGLPLSRVGRSGQDDLSLVSDQLSVSEAIQVLTRNI